MVGILRVRESVGQVGQPLGHDPTLLTAQEEETSTCNATRSF